MPERCRRHLTQRRQGAKAQRFSGSLPGCFETIFWWHRLTANQLRVPRSHFATLLPGVLALNSDKISRQFPKTGYASTSVSTRPKTQRPKSKSSVPPRWRDEVEKVLFTDEQIARRIKSLARDIEREFQGREMVVVSLLNGTVLFLADLIRHLNLPMRLDFMGVSSYGEGTES